MRSIWCAINRECATIRENTVNVFTTVEIHFANALMSSKAIIRSQHRYKSYIIKFEKETFLVNEQIMNGRRRRRSRKKMKRGNSLTLFRMYIMWAKLITAYSTKAKKTKPKQVTTNTSNAVEYPTYRNIEMWG